MTKREFIKEYLPLSESLFRVAYYILEDTQDAEDAVQDLFLKLWTSGISDTIENPKAYCITMMKNLCMDRIRRKHNTYCEPFSDRLTAEEDIERAIESKEELNVIYKAMDSLSESQRNVVRMKIIEDLTYDQISRQTGMNKLTLKVLMSQARRKLKNKL